MKGLNKTIYCGYILFRNIGAACLLAIYLSITAGIVSRYVFNRPFTWTEEVCTFMMAHVCFMSACITTAQKKHIVADFLVARASAAFKRVVNNVSRVLEMSFFVALFFSVVTILPQLVWKSPALQIPRQMYYISALVGSVYMFLAVLTDILNDFFPGYDLMAQANKRAALAAEAAERAAAEEMAKDMDSFMAASGYDTPEEERTGG